MVAQTESPVTRAEGAGRGILPQVKAVPDGRMRGCPPLERGRRIGPLALGLGIGAVLWLGIGLFSWQFFR